MCKQTAGGGKAQSMLPLMVGFPITVGATMFLLAEAVSIQLTADSNKVVLPALSIMPRRTTLSTCSFTGHTE